MTGAVFDHNIIMSNYNDCTGGYTGFSGNVLYANTFVNNTILGGSTYEKSNNWVSPEPLTYTYNGVTYSETFSSRPSRGSSRSSPSVPSSS